MCSHEPKWSNTLIGQALPRGWRAWVTSRGSMTALMRARYSNFRVQVQDQYWRQPQRSEARVLGISARQPVWVREVTLQAGNEIKIVARSVFPKKVLQGCGCLLSLGSRPLGDVLFSDPCVRRSKFQFTQSRVQHADKPVVGRRSVFTLRAGKLLVTEYFVEY